MTVEDVAWDYLRELADRSLIQASSTFYEGIPYNCHIHDLLREVIFSKSKEQNMVTVVNTGLHTRWPDKVRRLVINNFIDNSHQVSLCFKHLRSLITFGAKEPVSKTLLDELLSSKLLKVLDLRNARLEKISNEIFNLFHLKYLSLRGTRVKTVPKSIEKLQNLEYLNLAETEVKELPLEILKLQKLRHLWVFRRVYSANEDYEYYGFKAPSKMRELLALHTLGLIAMEATGENDEASAIFKEIVKLTQLRDLEITNLRREDGKELCYSLEKLTNLQELGVASVGKDQVIDLNYFFPPSYLQSLRVLVLRSCLEKMPQWIMCLQGLARIDLKWSRLREDPLESLQCLPNLVQVTLRQAYQGEGLCFKAGGFLKLKDLFLRQLESLRWMRVEEGAMPGLQQLILQDLPLLVELPLGIQHLRQLQKLELGDMSSQLIEKLENQGSEDYRQVAHIPQVVIAVWTDGEWRRRQPWGK